MLANDPLKLKNQIIIINIILHHTFLSNIYEYPEYHQHQYFQNQLKDHTRIYLFHFALYLLSCRLSSAGNVALSNEIPYLE